MVLKHLDILQGWLLGKSNLTSLKVVNGKLPGIAELLWPRYFYS